MKCLVDQDTLQIQNARIIVKKMCFLFFWHSKKITLGNEIFWQNSQISMVNSDGERGRYLSPLQRVLGSLLLLLLWGGGASGHGKPAKYCTCTCEISGNQGSELSDATTVPQGNVVAEMYVRMSLF